METLLERFSVKKGSYASLLKKILHEPNAKDLWKQAIEEMKTTYANQPDLLNSMISMYKKELGTLEIKEKAIVEYEKPPIVNNDTFLSSLKEFKKVDLLADLIPYYSNKECIPSLRHPLVHSVPHYDQLNDYVNKQYLHRKKEVEDARVSCNYCAYVFLHERPYRLKAFSEISEWLSDASYYELLFAIWIDSEDLYQKRELWQDLLVARTVMKKYFMPLEDRKELASLPNTLQVYRGYSPSKNRNGFSYTLDKSRAEWYACKYTEGKVKGKVQSIKISKDKIFAYTNIKNEQEVIILPVTKIHK